MQKSFTREPSSCSQVPDALDEYLSLITFASIGSFIATVYPKPKFCTTQDLKVDCIRAS